MVNFEKVSHQILNDALYNTLLFEIKERCSTQHVTQNIVENLLKKDSLLLQEYKEINRQSEISNIHVKNLQIKQNDDMYVVHAKAGINENICQRRS